ncbi:MAG: Ig-like domain-containing protein, partial [Candidatus Heimdallarchaeaceae archaeon]
DDIDPLVNITAPVNGSVVSRYVEINVNATDENGIVSYAIYIDGGLESTSSTCYWDSRNVNNGSHEISAICKDPANNVGQHNITVIVENEDLITGIDLIKVMTYNVEESGIDPDWKEVVKEENPDIVVFVETGYWDDDFDADLIAYTDEFNAYFTDEEHYESYTAQSISYSTSGEAIMSRFPILESVQITEVPLDNGTMYDVTHDFMFWNVNISGLEVYIIGVHLKAMGGAENEIRREYETEGIINYMDALGDHPILYMGDLNSFSPEDTGALAPTGNLGYGPLTMMLDPDDPTYGQYSSEVHNFIDIYRTLNPTTPGFTYPSYASRIDFIITNDFFVDYLINSTVGDTASADIASDHYSVDFFFDAYALINEIDIRVPAEVQGLAADWIATTQINLIWDANTETDLDYYRVFRDGVNIANTSNTYFNDLGLNPGIWYDYEVTAVDTNGNEGIPSDTFSVKTHDVVPEFPVFGLTILGLVGISALSSLVVFRRKINKV